MSEMDALLTLMGNNLQLVAQLGDCPNIEMHTNGGKVFWKDIDSKKGLRLQENIITGIVRILDVSDTQKAWGCKAAMKEKFNRLTRSEFLEPGDVIGVARKNALKIYEHYAVYIGDNRVIHYAADGTDFGEKVTIHEAPLSDFLKDDTEYFVLYFDRNNKSPMKIQSSTAFMDLDISYVNIFKQAKRRKYCLYSPKETIERAKSRIGEEKYNLVSNNCEHFAVWCKTGISESKQVDRVVQALAQTASLPQNNQILIS